MKLEIVDYDPGWVSLFAQRARRIRQALGTVALRIDHIGSTSIPGLAAKPIIDLQLSVASFAPVDAYRLPLERLGYVFRPDNPDPTKRYFHELPGERREQIHVRQAGSWFEQCALLFRDYLRAHPEDAATYARLKRELAEHYRDDASGYTRAKGPFIWDVLRRANDWAKVTGWEAGPSGA